MKIVTAAEMREIDRATIEDLGLPSLTLMENAGVQFVQTLERRFAAATLERITILCGKGNNGGDGFVIARQLWMRGLTPRAILCADPGRLSADARVNYQYLTRIGLDPWIARSFEEWLALKSLLLDSTLLVDALLGTGLEQPLGGYYLDLASDLLGSFPRVPIVAVDLPSGLPSDTGDYLGESVRATLTVTFTAPKVGQIFPPNQFACGELVVVPIGTPPDLLRHRADLRLNLLEPREVSSLLTPRLREAHKGDFGHILVVAGGRGKTGAAALTAESALRSGAGLVTVATAASAAPQVAAHRAEVMTHPLRETQDGSVSTLALDGAFADLAASMSVLAAGPGLGRHPETVEFIRRLIQDATSTMVLDADALNALAGSPEILQADGRTIVVTPHPGEMARLTGLSSADVQSRRVEIARGFARAHGVYVVLKGHRTLIAEPGGQVFVSPTGNPGMASAGMGDVLTGIIAAFLAQFSGKPPVEAICAAVYLHGLAGDLAAAELGELPLVASDILRFLPRAITETSRA